jgi:hypothetical protein
MVSVGLFVVSPLMESRSRLMAVSEHVIDGTVVTAQIADEV